MNANQKTQALPQDNTPALYVAIELSKETWRLAMADGPSRKARNVCVPAGDVESLREEFARAKKRFELPEEAPIRSCYEAGRDGFALHRTLEQIGVENLVIDASSLPIDRRSRRVKTDRIDAVAMLFELIRYYLLPSACGIRPIAIPTRQEEDLREISRHRSDLTTSATRLTNQVLGHLFKHGVRDLHPNDPEFFEQLDEVRGYDGAELQEHMKVAIRDLITQLRLVRRQIASLDEQIEELMAKGQDRIFAVAHQLQRLKGVGRVSATLLSSEMFGWRKFDNRRKVGGASGLCNSPWMSGNDARDQGISKHGSRHVRAVIIEVAWNWKRWQPQSELSQWFDQNFGKGKRNRRVGIVALARRLLILFWRFVEFGELPDGVELKAA